VVGTGASVVVATGAVVSTSARSGTVVGLVGGLDVAVDGVLVVGPASFGEPEQPAISTAAPATTANQRRVTT
jgi:hypothetical protein